MQKGKEFIASSIVRAFGVRPSIWLGSKLFPSYVPIFMLHRFACPSLDVSGHDASFLRWALEYLRKRRFNFVSIEAIATAMRDDEPLPPRSIAFSLDDGYWDQVEAGARIFAMYDCPATYFVATGFIDGHYWPWDAKVEYAVNNSSDDAFSAVCNRMLGRSASSAGRKDLIANMVAELKTCNFETINLKIDEWANGLEVQIPEKAPDRDAPTSWNRLRDLLRMGLQVGPHSYSHPILSQETEQVSRYEIGKSRNDLRRQIDECSNVFCYPVGRQQDFGDREEQIVEGLGFIGAVSAIPGTVNRKDANCLYSMPRYGFPDTKKNLIQYASWIEVLKGKIRAA